MKQLGIMKIGLITPLATKDCGTWEALRAGKCVELGTAVEEWALAEMVAGMPASVRDAVQAKDGRGLDKSIRLAIAAAGLAGGGDDPAAGLFCGTSKGPTYTMLAALELLRGGKALPARMAEQVALGVGAIGPMVQRALGLKGSVHTSVAACSSGLHALHRAVRALEEGECGRAVVVAADASLHPLFEGAFERLGVLAPADERGVRRCVPFDPEGKGFFVSEAAVAMVVERSPTATPIAWLERTWIGGDSTGLIAMDAETRTLRAGLRACAGEGEMAFVHAHATGTMHDLQEIKAIRGIFGGVSVFSHKGKLGHTLGAAGLIAVALSALCHQHGQTLEGQVVTPGGRSLTVAQGFGGHIAIARLRSA